MQNQENDLEYFLLISIIIVAIALNNYYPGIIQSIQSINDYFLQLTTSSRVYFIVSIIFIILFFLSYIFYKSVKFVSYKTAHLKDKARITQIEAEETENLISKKLKFDEQELTSDIEKIKQKISICKLNKKLFCFIPELKKRLAKATGLLEEFEKHKRAENLEIRNRKLKEENEELEKQNQEKIIQQENKKKAILYRFNNKKENVFLKESLTEEEIKALVENGYYSITEYCIINKKYVNVLVRPCLNHSPTHIFLVWNAKALLKKIKGVKDIQEHLTSDADLTFEYNGKKFALEIETGSLLGKKNQITEKLDYLNKKYKNRWMFIVSNKNLLPKYRKLGLSASRSKVPEKLAKLLENAHPV